MNKQWAALLIVLIVAMGISTAGADGRIVFSSDRDTDFDVWKMKQDGTYQIQITDDTGDAGSPSLTFGGARVFFHRDGDLFTIDHDGAGSPENLTSSLTLYQSIQGNTCTASMFHYSDPDVGKRINVAGDYRVIFAARFPYQCNTSSDDVYEIWMATFDLANGWLEDYVQITENITITDGAQLQPAWCGTGHVVWARNSTSGGYDPEICTVPYDASGPTDDPSCYKGNDNIEDVHPSCSPDGASIAWAREETGYAGIHDVCVMDFDGSNMVCITHLENHQPDDTQPTWSPDGLKIAFSSTLDGGDYHDIWVINADDSGTPHQLTTANFEDSYPDWSGVPLP